MVISTEEKQEIAAMVAQSVLAVLRAERQAGTAPAPESVSMDRTLLIHEVQEMLRCASISGTYAKLRELGVHPYTRGRYLWHDVHNAQAKASFKARTKGGGA